MKTRITYTLVACTIVTIAATIAQSQYSGIYAGTDGSGAKFIVAATKGGRLFATGADGRGLKDALDPSKSTVSDAGKIKAATPGGTSITGAISSDYKLTGTGKDSDGSTFRLSGKRVLR